MEMVQSAVNWVEIPAADFERAAKFYSAIFDYEMPTHPMGPNMMGFLLHEQGKGTGGAIVHGETYKPSPNGTLVYLNGGADLAVVLARVEAAGGKIVVPKTDIGGGMGFFAHFLDSEGNRVGLHSMS